MNVDPERLAKAVEHAAAMRAAIAKLDSRAMQKLLLDPNIERVHFEPGKRYRVAMLGSPPIDRRDPEPPRPTDTIRQGVDRMTGFDALATSEASGQIEISGTYRGRTMTVGNPHVFRLPNGEDALLGDMDVLAWELLT